jgi:hypothetical protein
MRRLKIWLTVCLLLALVLIVAGCTGLRFQRFAGPTIHTDVMYLSATGEPAAAPEVPPAPPADVDPSSPGVGENLTSSGLVTINLVQTADANSTIDIGQGKEVGLDMLNELAKAAAINAYSPDSTLTGPPTPAPTPPESNPGDGNGD